MGNNEGEGAAWSSAHGLSCQNCSCARSADKEGESCSSGQESSRTCDGRLVAGGAVVRECRHTSDQSFYVERGPRRTKRHRDRLFLRRDTLASGILFTQ